MLTIAACGLVLLAGCGKEVPSRTTSDFMNDPILLEAAMVRCARDRSRTRYEKECVNAREAANRIAAAEQEARRKELDRQSERKRQALRQAQLAAAEARRQATEAQRLREEAEYAQQFESPVTDGVAVVGNADDAMAQPDNLDGNAPGVILPAPDDETAGAVTPDEKPDSDLEAIREELKQRQEPSSEI